MKEGASVDRSVFTLCASSLALTRHSTRRRIQSRRKLCRGHSRKPCASGRCSDVLTFGSNHLFDLLIQAMLSSRPTGLILHMHLLTRLDAQAKSAFHFRSVQCNLVSRSAYLPLRPKHSSTSLEKVSRSNRLDNERLRSSDRSLTCQRIDET